MLATLREIDTTSPANPDLDEGLLQLYASIIRFQNMKDMAGVLSLVHNHSVGRLFVKQLLEPIFNVYTMQYSLVSHTYAGTDGEYTYYRARVNMEKIAGPDFRSSVTENLVLYRQQGDEWKMWNRLLLTMEPM